MMHLVRTRPFKLTPEIDALLGGFPRGWDHLAADRSRVSASATGPSVDVVESSADVTVRMAVPGYALADLEVAIEDKVLTVKGTRSYTPADGSTFRHREILDGEFTKTINLDDSADRDSVSARLSDGILEVTVGKQPEVLPKTVAIESA